jgi:PPOX class probable F420-dependent enzyme
MTSTLPTQVSEMLAKANPAVITTVRPDGQPVSVATWYILDDDGRIFVNMDEARKRLDYMRSDPRVTVTVLDSDDWYTHVSMQGRVSEIQDDPDLSGIDRLSRHYTGNDYPVRDRKRVNAWIDVDRWHGWGSAPLNAEDASSS